MNSGAHFSRPFKPSLSLEWLAYLRRPQAWILVLVCADLAVLADAFSGTDLWFGPVYLLAASLAAWTLGGREGQAVGLSCMTLTLMINGLSLYPNGEADLLWNLISRVVALSIVVAIVSNARRAYIREWWLARTDPLTGALNRQAFFELGVGLATNRNWRLLIYSDLDGLKQINDGQGHAMGDTTLKAYAAAVRKAIRRDDMFARVGGDEFVILMALKSEAAGRAVAARLHGVMNSIGSEDEDQDGIRCSVGALIVPPGDSSLDGLVRSADRLMYMAKMRGACLETGMATDVRQAPFYGRARKLARAPFAALSTSDYDLDDRRTEIAIGQWGAVKANAPD